MSAPSKLKDTGAIFVDPFGASHSSLRTPKGMGDLLPPEAEERRTLTRLVINRFELSGYDLIITPLFEHAEVVERGTDELDPRDLLRFVEPESGEVAVLRRAPRSATATAVGRTSLLVLDADDLRALMQRDKRIAERIKDVVEKRVGHRELAPKGNHHEDKT